MSLSLNFNTLNFDEGTPVICVAKKFIFPVGKFESEGGGDPLVYPAGHEKAGEQITDQYNPKVAEFGKGIVFKNRNESVSTAMSDGESIFIVNEVKEEDASKIADKIKELGGDTRNFTKAQTLELLDTISQLGYNDIYSSDMTFHGKKFASTDELQSGIPGLSYGKRNDRVEGKPMIGIFVEGEDVAFTGQAKSAGNTQTHAHGLLAIFDKASPAGDQVRSIDAEKLRTYVLADGSPIQPGKNIATVQAAKLARS